MTAIEVNFRFLQIIHVNQIPVTLRFLSLTITYHQNVREIGITDFDKLDLL